MFLWVYKLVLEICLVFAGSLGVSWDVPWDPWGSFGRLGGLLRILGGPLGVIWGLFGSPLGILWAPGRILDDFGTVSGALLGSNIKVLGNISDECRKTWVFSKIARRRDERLVLEVEGIKF